MLPAQPRTHRFPHAPIGVGPSVERGRPNEILRRKLPPATYRLTHVSFDQVAHVFSSIEAELSRARLGLGEQIGTDADGEHMCHTLM